MYLYRRAFSLLCGCASITLIANTPRIKRSIKVPFNISRTLTLLPSRNNRFSAGDKVVRLLIGAG